LHLGHIGGECLEQLHHVGNGGLIAHGWR
jgi:hypothetical protein